MSPHKYFSHIIQIFSILLSNLGSHKYFPYKPHKLSWVLSQILSIISHILSNLIFHKNTYHITTKIGPQNYTISTKRPKLIYLVGKTQKSPTKPSKSPLLHDTSKTHCYMTIFFTKSQKVQILFWHIFTKPKYYFGNYVQSPNTMLAHTYKAQYYFGNYL